MGHESTSRWVDNSNFGGNVRVASHLDGIVVAPTVEVDGVVIMDSGKFIH